MLSNQADAIRQAEQLAEKGNLSAAIAIYRSLIEADPLDLNSVQAIGDLYVRSGRIQEALHELGRLADRCISLGPAINATPPLKRMLDLDPSNAAVRLKLATVYSRAGKSEQALQTYIEAGSTFARKGNLVAAMEAIRKALAINPDSPQAQAAYKALGGQPAPTPPPVIEHPKPPPATPKTTSRMRDTTELAELGQMLSAASAEFAPTDITDEFIVKQLFDSELLAGCGDTDKAIASLKRIIQFRPDHVEVRTKLTDIYLRSGKMREASHEFVEIARIYENKGDVARSKDFSVRAQRLMQPREESRPGTSAPQAASPKVNKPHRVEARPGTLPGLSHVADTSLNLVVHTKSLRSGEEVVAPSAAPPPAVESAAGGPSAGVLPTDSIESEPTAPVVAPPGAVAPIGIVRRE